MSEFAKGGRRADRSRTRIRTSITSWQRNRLGGDILEYLPSLMGEAWTAREREGAGHQSRLLAHRVAGHEHQSRPKKALVKSFTQNT